MNALRTSGLERVFAALLVLALVLAGVGRGLAAGGDLRAPPLTIAGALVPICHSDGGSSDPADPGGSGHHGNCDQCALCAPVILAASPDVADVAPVGHEVLPAAVAGWKARLARARTPRQSQGPPDA